MGGQRRRAPPARQRRWSLGEPLPLTPLLRLLQTMTRRMRGRGYRAQQARVSSPWTWMVRRASSHLTMRWTARRRLHWYRHPPH